MRNKGFVMAGVALVIAAVLAGAFFLGKNQPARDSKHQDVKVQSTSQKRAAKNSSSQSTDKAKNQENSAFSALPQKTQLALLIYKELPTDYGTGYKTHYTIYMGDPDKIVIVDDGEGAGGMPEHCVMYTDNHDGTFTTSVIDSTAVDLADYSAQNSYWKATQTISQSDLMTAYQEHRDEIDYVTGLFDLGYSARKFVFLPTNQTSIPR
ncbi:hypothetical protein [Fructobacillus papyrifericola]|uniref:Lipoprotein n=1 Tax=Fructobacillus papyrifericola TaxID=2713172 RepID=A0ABS5QT41_9LACO|nr:hypothetical protein [Fructobacillus papyrifericola]MBS9336368.1 hypothetical protein [Fructobacillus papyrifericola]